MAGGRRLPIRLAKVFFGSGFLGHQVSCLSAVVEDEDAAVVTVLCQARRAMRRRKQPRLGLRADGTGVVLLMKHEATTLNLKGFERVPNLSLAKVGTFEMGD